MYALNNDILESFAKINKAINRLLKHDADRVGITVVQLKALYTLSINPDISLGELAEKLRLTNSTVSGVVDRLVHNGLVDRIVPPENRRAVFLHLTENGKGLLNQLYSSGSILIKRFDEILNLPNEELEHLLRLHKLVLSKLTLEEEKYS